MNEKNVKLLMAKILGILVTFISVFMLINVFSFLFKSLTGGTTTMILINTIITIIYMLFIIIINVAIFIRFIRFKDNDKHKRNIFYLGCILLAFFISILQEKIPIAYVVYFISAVYFLIIFMLTRDIFRKKEKVEEEKKVENNKEPLNLKDKDKDKKSYIPSIIVIVVILVVIAFETFSYINIVKLAEKYNELNNTQNELNQGVGSEEIETNQPQITNENFNKAYKTEALMYVIKMIYLSITILLIILTLFISNKKFRLLSKINIWLLFVISAFLASNLAIYYISQPILILYLARVNKE